MTHRQRLVRVAIVLLVFGCISLTRVLGRPSMELVRGVDAVQLFGTGMCFGAAILALVLVLFGRSPQA